MLVAEPEPGSPEWLAWLDCLRWLAEQGDAAAQFELGVMYHVRDVHPWKRNYEEAAHWYRLAAEQGHAWAQCKLGDMYSCRDYVPQDDEEAVKWYGLAADSSDHSAKAQSSLGDMYYYGRTVPQNYKKAVGWYSLAAKQGDARAQYNLGLMYEAARGGLPQDRIQAYKWEALAVSRAHVSGCTNKEDLRAKAVEARKRIANFMAPDEIRAAQRLADNWRSRWERN